MGNSGKKDFKNLPGFSRADAIDVDAKDITPKDGDDGDGGGKKRRDSGFKNWPWWLKVPALLLALPPLIWPAATAGAGYLAFKLLRNPGKGVGGIARGVGGTFNAITGLGKKAIVWTGAILVALGVIKCSSDVSNGEKGPFAAMNDAALTTLFQGTKLISDVGEVAVPAAKSSGSAAIDAGKSGLEAAGQGYDSARDCAGDQKCLDEVAEKSKSWGRRAWDWWFGMWGSTTRAGYGFMADGVVSAVSLTASGITSGVKGFWGIENAPPTEKPEKESKQEQRSGKAPAAADAKAAKADYSNVIVKICNPVNKAGLPAGYNTAVREEFNRLMTDKNSDALRAANKGYHMTLTLPEATPHTSVLSLSIAVKAFSPEGRKSEIRCDGGDKNYVPYNDALNSGPPTLTFEQLAKKHKEGVDLWNSRRLLYK